MSYTIFGGLQRQLVKATVWQLWCCVGLRVIIYWRFGKWHFTLNIKVNTIVSLLYVDSPLPLFKIKKTLLVLRFSVFMSHLWTNLHLFGIKTLLQHCFISITRPFATFSSKTTTIPFLPLVYTTREQFFCLFAFPPRFFKIDSYPDVRTQQIHCNQVEFCSVVAQDTHDVQSWFPVHSFSFISTYIS